MKFIKNNKQVDRGTQITHDRLNLKIFDASTGQANLLTRTKRATELQTFIF